MADAGGARRAAALLLVFWWGGGRRAERALSASASASFGAAPSASASKRTRGVIKEGGICRLFEGHWRHAGVKQARPHRSRPKRDARRPRVARIGAAPMPLCVCLSLLPRPCRLWTTASPWLIRVRSPPIKGARLGPGWFCVTEEREGRSEQEGRKRRGGGRERGGGETQRRPGLAQSHTRAHQQPRQISTRSKNHASPPPHALARPTVHNRLHPSSCHHHHHPPGPRHGQEGAARQGHARGRVEGHPHARGGEWHRETRVWGLFCRRRRR